MVREEERISGVTAVILAGGFGTRLRSVVKDTQKVLASVGGRPFLEIIFDRLIGAGIKKVVLCTGFLGDQVENLYGAHYKGLEICISQENSPLGTGGAIRNALSCCSTENLLVLNGDSFVEVDYEAFFGFFRDGDALASLVLCQVPDVSRFGSVTVSLDTCQIEEFREKSTATGSGWINAGVYLIPKDLIERLPLGKVISLEKDVFPVWCDEEILSGFPLAEGRFIDIGTPESYAEAGRMFGGDKI